MHAIPTRYKGVQFRSRLEARYAAFFTLRGIPWRYEPIDLPGWIPDFILGPIHFQSDDGGHSHPYVEIKPGLTRAELRPEYDQIERMISGHWERLNCIQVVVFGVEPPIHIARSWDFADGGAHFWAWPRGWERDWIEAGNLVQWKAPK